jgi:hypothetical protein
MSTRYVEHKKMKEDTYMLNNLQNVTAQDLKKNVGAILNFFFKGETFEKQFKILLFTNS